MAWFLLPILLILPLCAYLFFCVRRAVRLFAPHRSTKFIHWVTAPVTVGLLIGLGVWCGSVSFWGVTVLHLGLLLWLTQLINMLLHKLFAGKPLRVWNIIYCLGVLPVLLTAGLYLYGWVNIRTIRQTDYTLVSDKLSGDGYTAVLLADVHYGTIIDHDKMQKAAQRISAQNPDFVLLCGDIVDEDTSRSEMEDVFHILGGIKSKYGIYSVYGNHDAALYTEKPAYSEAQLAKAITDNGIHILADEVISITDDLMLIGRKDMGDERLSVEKLMTQADCSNYCVMLDHQPYEFAEKAATGVDLQLSGHAHAGQLFPVGWFMKLMGISDLYYGYARFDGMDAVVTAGLSGWGFPIKTQEHSEYVVLHLLPE